MLLENYLTPYDIHYIMECCWFWSILVFSTAFNTLTHGQPTQKVIPPWIVQPKFLKFISLLQEKLFCLFIHLARVMLIILHYIVAYIKIKQLNHDSFYIAMEKQWNSMFNSYILVHTSLTKSFCIIFYIKFSISIRNRIDLELFLFLMQTQSPKIYAFYFILFWSFFFLFLNKPQVYILISP